ncbi:GNAT family N-acetyltransferase [Candidatus Beckwithbacteria bacterium]|nr:GNAT family N-acetyltransferase [Candidatus Beckwithbacteria bacterium]
MQRITTFDQNLISNLFTQIGETNLNPNPKYFDNKQNILLVAYDDNELSGFLYAYLLESLDQLSGKIFLYSVDVFAKFRRQGIATQLITELKQLARNNNCSEIFVLTNQNNQAAMRLYQKTQGVRENNDDVMFVYNL